MSTGKDVTDMAGTSSLSIFHPFPRLPIEIRELIWKSALPGPRIVFLQEKRLVRRLCTRVWSNQPCTTADNIAFFDEDFNDKLIRNYAGTPYYPSGEPAYYDFFGFHSHSTIPLIYTCKEVYHVASKVYTRAFDTGKVFPDTWFDFEMDTLYLDCKSIWWLDLGSDIWKVRNLAIAYDRNRERIDPFRMERIVADVLVHFQNVQNLALILEHHDRTKAAAENPVFVDAIDVKGGNMGTHLNKCRELARTEFPMAVEAYPDPGEWDSLNTPGSLQVFWLEQKHEQDMKDNLPWNIPQINIRIITTSERKQSYLAKKEAEEAIRQETRVNLLLGSPGYESVELETYQSAQLLEIIKWFRGSRGLEFVYFDEQTIMNLDTGKEEFPDDFETLQQLLPDQRDVNIEVLWDDHRWDDSAGEYFDELEDSDN